MGRKQAVWDPESPCKWRGYKCHRNMGFKGHLEPAHLQRERWGDPCREWAAQEILATLQIFPHNCPDKRVLAKRVWGYPGKAPSEGHSLSWKRGQVPGTLHIDLWGTWVCEEMDLEIWPLDPNLFVNEMYVGHLPIFLHTHSFVCTYMPCI